MFSNSRNISLRYIHVTNIIETVRVPEMYLFEKLCFIAKLNYYYFCFYIYVNSDRHVTEWTV